MKIVSIHHNKSIWKICEELTRKDEQNAKRIDPYETRRLTITVEEFVERRSYKILKLLNSLNKHII